MRGEERVINKEMLEVNELMKEREVEGLKGVGRGEGRIESKEK